MYYVALRSGSLVISDTSSEASDDLYDDVRSFVTLTTVFLDESGVKVTGDAGLGVKHNRCPEVLFQSICVYAHSEHVNVYTTSTRLPMCSDVSFFSDLHLRALWEHEFMAFVRTRVCALDFKRNQKSQLSLTTTLRHTRAAMSSAFLAKAGRVQYSWTVRRVFIYCNGVKVVSSGFFVTVSLILLR